MTNKLKQNFNKFNEFLAVKITTAVGTMECAYLFFILDLIMLPPVIKSHDIIVWVTYIAQTVLQLLLLPIILVGQNVQSRQQETQSKETQELVKKIYDNLMIELNKQNEQSDKILETINLITTDVSLQKNEMEELKDHTTELHSILSELTQIQNQINNK